MRNSVYLDRANKNQESLIFKTSHLDVYYDRYKDKYIITNKGQKFVLRDSWCKSDVTSKFIKNLHNINSFSIFNVVGSFVIGEGCTRALCRKNFKALLKSLKTNGLIDKKEMNRLLNLEMG